ncbi:probable C-mannosyltransferase DPY19L1 isoform X2 [Hyla sarda]|uniref:probable C-mannosyltransferase DPY19L1 isoform X2 n=1 Tax=Hyla sarda TaxID=327740 RepID=UPI0024C3F360|nr:probable C-mannosyltransferase DPY19L1 isoform X2 [Hyla sarda]
MDVHPRHRQRGSATSRGRNRTPHPGTESSQQHHRSTGTSHLSPASVSLGSTLLIVIIEKLAFIKALDKRIWITLYLAAFVGVLHWSYISTLFESDRHFSHLSTLEREMAFRTEMGLYYSYFKSIIEAPSYFSGLQLVMNDNVTEYPSVINTLKRFNLYPEVILASLFRIYTATMSAVGIETKLCWTVNRGSNLRPVESCEGLGDPAYFYVTQVFILNGVMMSLFFIYGSYLSESWLGGFITVLCFFYNHGESTRVMWTPPLRESFSYPFLVFQMFLLTYILRTPTLGRRSQFLLCVSNVFFMLPWQFAQFVLLTQIASLFAIYVLGYLDSEKFLKILYTHMVSLGLCFILMFGNSMLLTSYYASSLVVICIIAKSRGVLKLEVKALINWVLQVLICILGTVALKALTSTILGVKDDAHIFNILKSKFTSYKDFDTLMYTCAPEFDFMESETPWRYLKTLLLPVVIIVFLAICVSTLKDTLTSSRQKNNRGPDNERLEHSTSGELVYHALQLLAFAVLAILIMRLKLFLTPHMCLMASLLCSRQGFVAIMLFGWIFSRLNRQLFIAIVVVLMSIQGIRNIQTQLNIKGEFSNIAQEELLEWIKFSTRPNSVFAGAMPTMASVKLSTGRPIVNHPHYEDAGLRMRTKMVYSMYSRKPAEEVKKRLIDMGVHYFILEDAWCTRRTKTGCTMSEIWDIEDPSNVGKIPLCSVLAKDSLPHFATVFQNNIYKVLKVNTIPFHIR